MLRIVAATRQDREGFHRQTALGGSLGKLLFRDVVSATVNCRNSRGLPEVFNAALAGANDTDVIVFTHDDVWIDDWFLPERLDDALARFAVVGVAGNRRRVPRQPSWAKVDTAFTWDAWENLSGSVGHVLNGIPQVIWYGESPSAAKLLDGVFLAARVKTLREAGVSFDPQFRFHFYDLDFCRSCERAGLAMGTWPIAITHASKGHLGSPEWTKAYEDYLAKWKE